MKNYNLGRFLLSKEDFPIVTVDKKTGQQETKLCHRAPWDWELDKQGEMLQRKGWRLPEFEELWFIGELAELGVGGLNSEPDYSNKAKTWFAGYWSSTEEILGNEDYCIIELHNLGKDKKRLLGNTASAGGRSCYRIRLIQPIQNSSE